MKAILVYIATYMSSVFKTYGVRLVDLKSPCVVRMPTWTYQQSILIYEL